MSTGDYNAVCWERERAQICNTIIKQVSDFKIVLKIKDDAFFFERWVQHHSKIVGLNNLIIFDNSSQDTALLDLYTKYQEQITIISFQGFHNNLHRVNIFPELYHALRSSCQYFLFLDCDEFLVCVERDLRLLDEGQITQRVLDTRAGVLPASWLENVQGSDRKYWWDVAQNHPISNLRSGKPILRHDKELSGMINHNWQVGIENFDDLAVTNFFILHLKRLSIDQRVLANIRKLEAYNAFKGPFSIGDIVKLDSNTLPAGNKRNWVREIQKLMDLKSKSNESKDGQFSNGMVELCDQGTLTFSTAEQRDTFLQFLSRPLDSICNAIPVADAG